MAQHQTSGMSVAQGAALTIGAVLGTGVISLPAIAAGIAGPASILAWLALVLLSAPLAVLLTVATVAALPHADLGNLMPFAPHGWGEVAPAAAVVVWGFAGWEAVTSLTADYRNPARDVPRAAVVAVVVVGVLYLGVVATSILVLGPRAAATQAPLAELLGVAFGAPGRS